MIRSEGANNVIAFISPHCTPRKIIHIRNLKVAIVVSLHRAFRVCHNKHEYLMTLCKAFLLAQKSTQIQILPASCFPDVIVELVVGVDNAPVNFMLQYDSLKALIYVFRREAVILRIHKKEMFPYEVHAFGLPSVLFSVDEILPSRSDLVSIKVLFDA